MDKEYYVDPLEQEAKMKEKLEKIDEPKTAEIPEDEQLSNIHPDMNITGFFSTGNTAKKTGFMHRSASPFMIKFGFVFGIISAIYSALYLFILISQRFYTNWFLSWLYAVVAIFALVILINSLRSLKVKNDNLKRNVLVGIFCAIISFAPLIAWVIHWFLTVFN